MNFSSSFGLVQNKKEEQGRMMSPLNSFIKQLEFGDLYCNQCDLIAYLTFIFVLLF